MCERERALFQESCVLSSTSHISFIVIETRVKERQRKLEKEDERTKERKRET